MALADIINQIRNLSQRDQQRLKEFFTNSLGSAGETESVFTDVSNRKTKTATPAPIVNPLMSFASVNIR
ncbi:hypothetical protein SRABI84_05166 [Peribacillus simplex]|nr:hypothetical protein SRABI84_05166 [Peribacillus simplex]